jgi:hypothetical protein
MTETLFDSLRSLKGLLFVAPLLALPLMIMAPAMSTPAFNKQGAGLVLFVTLQRSTMQ